VNGADLNQLLCAALSVAREQPNEKIAELEHDLDASTQRRWQLEDEVRELQERNKRLARKCETKRKGR
jgi:predicted  nucleic acid-binding Zn-ribbon protein